MRLNACLAILVVVLFSSLLFWQINTVSADNQNGPVTSPLTSPVSPTPEPTVTPTPTVMPTVAPTQTPQPTVTPTPAPEVVLSGHVDYHFQGVVRLLKYHYDFKIPAVGVQVVETNVLTGENFHLNTDLMGNFSFNLPAGKYSVSVSDNFGTKFTPAQKTVTLKKKDKVNLYFQGHTKLDSISL